MGLKLEIYMIDQGIKNFKKATNEPKEEIAPPEENNETTEDKA